MESTRTPHRRSALALAALTALLPFGATAADPAVCGTDDGTGCAPQEARVDLTPPTFSDPLTVTNPLHPSSTLRSGVMLGLEDGVPFRVEITLLPEPRVIDLDGVEVAALESQYAAYLDGRIDEVALDWFAQADDGSVWYLGEDVFNYEDGVVADTEGTWMAGRDAPPAMIMPADPQVGDVYRPENAPGVVFEEVVVSRIGLDTVGPSGAVESAIEVDELHMDGSHEAKVFAPGYGEFSTGGYPNVELIALAVPTDALAEPVPDELATISAEAQGVLAALIVGDWDAAESGLEALSDAWETLSATDVPPLLAVQLAQAADSLAEDVEAKDVLDARSEAIAVAQAALDIQLRYRDPASIDIDRFSLWLDQVAVDADDDDVAGVLSDVAALEWTFDRFSVAISEGVSGDIDRRLGSLRTAAEDGDLSAVMAASTALQRTIAGLVLAG